MVKGFNQEYGIDYAETFAPVARLTSVRSLIVVTSVRLWDLFQMDVKKAFSMVILVKKFICRLRLDTIILHTSFVDFAGRCMI